MNLESKSTLNENWVKKVLEERGILIAPPDHWIYSEGASSTFIQRAPTGKKRTSAKNKTPLLEEGEQP